MDKEIIREFFNGFAPNWDNEPIAEKEIIDTILNNAEIKESINVLDIACGTGVLFPFYLERNVKSITAVDLSPEMVKIAKSKFPQADVICGDADSISFQKQFDVTSPLPPVITRVAAGPASFSIRSIMASIIPALP